MRTIQSTSLIALTLAVGVGTGCSDSDSESETDSASPVLDLSQIPVPAADGPPMHVLAAGVRVAEKPGAGGRILGHLRIGATVARSDKAYSREGCDGGWYAIRPRGFVCAGEGTSTEAGPADLIMPDLSRALPYRYARLRAPSPRYARIPAVDEMFASEPKLESYLKKRDNPAEEEWGNSANDVPLSEQGFAVGPPVLLSTGEGVSSEGTRTTASFFSFGRFVSPPVPSEALFRDASSSPIRKGSFVALTGVVQMEEGPQGPRELAVLTNGELVPVDRLTPELGSIWHGIAVAEEGLPIAFIHKYGVHKWDMAKKPEELEDELLRRTAVQMSGRFRTVNGERYEHANDGYWLRSRDLIKVVKRSKLPDFASGNQKWIDVSLANQTMTLYEGRKAIYVTLISSGRDVLGDPQMSAATPRGDFRVSAKYITRDLDPREVERSYDVRDAPWVLEFQPMAGAAEDQQTVPEDAVPPAIVGSYFRDRQGQASMFHDIALSPIDARLVWMWSSGEVPNGWHGVQLDPGTGTIVNIRK